MSIKDKLFSKNKELLTAIVSIFMTSIIIVDSFTYPNQVLAMQDGHLNYYALPVDISVEDDLYLEERIFNEVLEANAGLIHLNEKLYLADENNEKELVVEAISEVESDVQSYLTEYEIDLIALIVMAEAEGQCEEGQRLVIDVILNRVESDYFCFPDSVYEVIYQEDQFECVWNGRVNECYVKEEIRQMVIEESISKLHEDVVFFRTKHFFSFGTPVFQVGDHYFSSL